ncbi:MAG: PhoH family protein, partial [Thermodesulfovibrionales bacterium]
MLVGGIQDSFRVIEDAFGVMISSRGNKVILKGEGASLQTAENLINEIFSVYEMGFTLKPEDIRYAVEAVKEGNGTSLKELFTNHIPVSSKKRFIIPKNTNQKNYLEAIKNF